MEIQGLDGTKSEEEIKEEIHKMLTKYFKDKHIKFDDNLVSI